MLKGPNTARDRAAGLARGLVLAGAILLAMTAGALPAAAQGPRPTEDQMPVDDFRMLHFGSSMVKDLRLHLHHYFAGLRVALTTVSNAYVANGARRRICIPPEVETDALIDMLADELEKNAAYWDRRPNWPVVPVAVDFFIRKWPCP